MTRNLSLQQQQQQSGSPLSPSQPNLEGSSEEALTKDPPASALESQPDHSTKTRLDALDAKNLDTCRRIAT